MQGGLAHAESDGFYVKGLAFVPDFPATSATLQASITGDCEPRRRRDGRELHIS